jgi:hypothetical protein
MPYVDIARDDDFVSFWYITNSCTGHASSFNHSRPTVLLLHPVLLDCTWLNAQFGDPRLHDGYNLIAFDWRASGKTMSRYSGKQDAWTDAIDIALVCYVRFQCASRGTTCHSRTALQALCLPAVHVWASEAISVDAAIRFAILCVIAFASSSCARHRTLLFLASRSFAFRSPWFPSHRPSACFYFATNLSFLLRHARIKQGARNLPARRRATADVGQRRRP